MSDPDSPTPAPFTDADGRCPLCGMLLFPAVQTRCVRCYSVRTAYPAVFEWMVGVVETLRRAPQPDEPSVALPTLKVLDAMMSPAPAPSEPPTPALPLPTRGKKQRR